MYKITFTGSIKRLSDSTIIPPVSDNSDYQQFVDDIYVNWIGIVEGADYVGVTTYTEARIAEYPPIVDQLDKIYHSGVDAWKADIKVIKDKYPKTQVGITSIAPIPDWVNTALFDKQKEKYIEAKERLDQYELSAGMVNEGGYLIIQPLPISVIDDDGNTIRNPLVVADETERAAAQSVIDSTPTSVVDSINT